MKTIMQSLRDPWRRMIAIDVAIMLGLFVYKILYYVPTVPYLHLIIDYHFGFTKRALVDTLLSFILPVVPVWFVFVLGGAVWLLALVLFLKLFKKNFGFDSTTIPLFAFLFGSPFFLKNFVQTIGYFDIYGCVFALVMLLIPARSLVYVVIGGLGCAVLVLIHHLQVLLYVPVIGLIVVMRYYFVRELTVFDVIAGAFLTLLVGGTFMAVVLYGAMPASMEQLIGYLRGRSYNLDALAPLEQALDIWYRPIDNDIARTWNVLPNNLPRFPIYAALIALHWPVIRLFKRLILALASSWHRRLTVVGIVGVSLGYVVIGTVVFDYARWVSDWGVCMILLLHAVKMLPARETVPSIADDKANRTLAWILTIIPRVGINKPF